MICEICGYDSEQPLGIALEDAKAGESAVVSLNNNGKLWVKHKANCLRELPIEVVGL